MTRAILPEPRLTQNLCVVAPKGSPLACEKALAGSTPNTSLGYLPVLPW